MKYKLIVSTATWTHEDVAFGANDAEKNTIEEKTFGDVGQVVAFLRENNLTEPSSYPVVDSNMHILWFAEPSKTIAPGEEENDRIELTASRAEDFPLEDWKQVVRDVVAGKGGWQDDLFVYATGREDLPIAVGTHTHSGVNGSFALFADEYAASVFITHYAKDRGYRVSILPSAEQLGVELLTD